ncbi:MAG: hypothetical protein ABI895_39815 [Deltaproteobacteria bacterium]
MQEARAFTGHGVFVAARQVEDALLQPAEIDRQCQEGVIAIDDDQRSRVRHGSDQSLQIGNDIPGVEEHVGQEHEIVQSRVLTREQAALCVAMQRQHVRPVHLDDVIQRRFLRLREEACDHGIALRRCESAELLHVVATRELSELGEDLGKHVTKVEGGQVQ